MAKKKLTLENAGKTGTEKPTAGTAFRRRSEEDRRAHQAVRLANVMRLQELLLGYGKFNVKGLAGELEVSAKTIHRYLSVLEIAGVPWYYDRHERCYRVRPGFKFSVSNLSPDELVGQAAATAVTTATGLDVAADAKPVTRKLAALATEEMATLLADAEAVMSVLDLKLADHSRHREMIRTVQWSVIKGRQVTGQYRSPYQEQPVRLTIHPYRLCLAGQAWYLIGRSIAENAPKTYRIARFQSLRMIDAVAQQPKDFDLSSYFGDAWCVYRGQEHQAVEIEFTREAAALVAETRWHRTQQVKRLPDGRARLSFHVDGLEEIMWWVLGWASRATVIRPEKLRGMVVEKLRAGIGLNAGTGCNV